LAIQTVQKFLSMRLAGCNLLKCLEVPMAGWWLQHPCKNTNVISDQHPLWTDGKIQVVETISRIMCIYIVFTLIYIIIIIHLYINTYIYIYNYIYIRISYTNLLL
jgi:hypothetical protein